MEDLRTRTLLFCAVLALAIVATASARTVRPRWTEQQQFNRGKVLFQVRTFSYGNWGWKVGARIINHSPFSFHQTNDDKTRAPYYLGGFQIVHEPANQTPVLR